MKKSSIAIAAIVALVGPPAFAADMALKAPPPAPLASWAGWYVGLNAGWVGSTNNTIANTGTDRPLAAVSAAPLQLASSRRRSTSVTAGFSAADKLVITGRGGNVVYGLEADLDAVSARSNVSLPDAKFVPVLGGLQSPFTIKASPIQAPGMMRDISHV